MSTDEDQALFAIDDQTAIDDLRELTLEAPKSLAGGLVLSELALVVVPPRAWVHRLDPRVGTTLG